MTQGMWTMADDGTFELQEPFSTYLKEAKVTATRGWADGLIGYLEPRCPYTAQELFDPAHELVLCYGDSTQR